MEQLRLIRRSFPEDPELSTAISRAILTRVASGDLAPTLRLHRPGREEAFGRQDVSSPGYPAAREATIESGFAAVERLAGGRAAVFHEGTIAIARSYADPQPPRRTYRRFEEISGWVAGGLRRLGIEARVGEIAGEYCPGAYSVNASGRVKLAGIGQRMIRGAAHVGGVVVVSGEAPLRDVLVPVYRALDLDWRPETAGSAAGELDRPLELSEVEEALLEELTQSYELVPAEVDEETLRLAREMLAR